MSNPEKPVAQPRSGDADYDVLLLDFGGVCLLNPVELHAKAERLLGMPSGSLTWLGPLNPSTDELWRRMIDGDGVTERDYWTMRAADVGRMAGRSLSRSEYMTLLYDPPGPDLIRPEATAVVTAARQAGYGVSVLTNDMKAFHGDEWVAQVEFLALCDQVVDLSDTGHLKPDPKGYAAAVSSVGAEPDRILFVDDQPINVEGAKVAGIDAMWFDIAAAAEAWSEVAARLGV